MPRYKRIADVTFACMAALSTFLAGSATVWSQGDSAGHWSFRPVRVAAVPEVIDPAWTQSPIDRFILSALTRQGLTPSPPASRGTLLRRVTFDLTGLPPTLDECLAFTADESPDAFSRLVDRLLASPQYGPHWSRHWLDVVRYADARDLIQLPRESDFREAWRYRDWVVAACNQDLPYDQFIARQIAGDLMQPVDPDHIDADALVATGLLAIADFVPGDVDKEQMIADYVNDQIDVLGRAVLGLTLACARCHDHKFDPISTDDYYALAGIFFSTRLVPGPVKGNTPLVRVPLVPRNAIAAREAQLARDTARLAELSHDLEHLGEREYRSYLERQALTATEAYLLAAWEASRGPASREAPALLALAEQRHLDPAPLGRWIARFDERHAALASIDQAKDQAEAKSTVRQLVDRLATVAAARRRQIERDPTAKALADSTLLVFRADDQGLAAPDASNCKRWPNRGHGSPLAEPAKDAQGPALVKVAIGPRTVPALRFTGKEQLQIPARVPTTGSLFVVFRSDPAGGSGQRLVGWEDAAVGQHGVGIMTDGTGRVHAILRRAGASGDVMVPAPGPPPVNEALPANGPAFQVLTITWGGQGVTVYRDGQLVGTNQAILAVSSDPAITALQIGGPGSGSSPRFQGELAELRVYDVPLDDPARMHVERELTARWCGRIAPAATDEPTLDLFENLVNAQSPYRLEVDQRERVFSDEFRRRISELRLEFESLQAKKPVEIPYAVVVQDGGPPGTTHEGFRDAHVFVQGNHQQRGKVVPRGIPKSLGGTEPFVIREGSGRRELAAWLTSPVNPLTTRVAVNRVWQHQFGAGLVRTSTNFGVMGEAPSHPELLDYLAERLIASNWSIKDVQRRMVLSAVYQQSSANNDRSQLIDPENRWLSHANRRKLQAESVRDSLLAVAGELDLLPGGPGFQELGTPRRTLYLLTARTGAKTSDFGSIFDAADCAGIVERRTESIVAPQALFLMNDPLVTRLARTLAERVTGDESSGDSRQRLEQLYRLALGRSPTAAELEIGERFLAESPDAWTGYCRVILCTNEFSFVD